MTSNVLVQFLGGKNTAHLRRWINLYPPFLGAGIRIVRIAPDMKALDVEMKLRWWNANYVGSYFGKVFSLTRMSSNCAPNSASPTRSWMTFVSN